MSLSHLPKPAPERYWNTGTTEQQAARDKLLADTELALHNDDPDAFVLLCLRAVNEGLTAEHLAIIRSARDIIGPKIQRMFEAFGPHGRAS